MGNKSIKLGTVLLRGRFFGRLLYSKITNNPTPLFATFSLTSFCNYECAYCYGDYKNRRNKEKLVTTEQVLATIEELSQMGMIFLQLHGGEPLLRDDIEIIVDRANELGVVLGICTNGSLIEEKIEIVKKIKTIAISFDGDEKSNDANRGKGTYKTIVRAIRTAKEAGIIVHIVMTITKNNLNAIDYFMEFAKEFNIYTLFGFPVIRALKNDESYRDLGLSNEEVRNAVKKILAYKRRGYPILYSAKLMEKILDWPDYSKKIYVSDKHPSFNHIRCYAGMHSIFIECDGKVYPCLQLIGAYKALDFREAGIKKAIEHAAKHNCTACYNMCINDLNLMFNLNPSALFNNLKITFRECLRRGRFNVEKYDLYIKAH